ncbi:uncharacterized protein ACN427_011920 [Glossina fuscipes fuscipes]
MLQEVQAHISLMNFCFNFVVVVAVINCFALALYSPEKSYFNRDDLLNKAEAYQTLQHNKAKRLPPPSANVSGQDRYSVDQKQYNLEQRHSELVAQLESQHQEFEGLAKLLRNQSSNELQTNATYVSSPKKLNFISHVGHKAVKSYVAFNSNNEPSKAYFASAPTKFSRAADNKLYFVNNEIRYGIENDLDPDTNYFRKPALKYGEPGGASADGSAVLFSKQILYAPKRPRDETKLPYSYKYLPNPPSFITFTTTTEKPANYNIKTSLYHYNHKPYHAIVKSTNNIVPDFFTYRHSKSLLDSYIPSWQVAKMLQQYQHQLQATGAQTAFNNNLHTLAFLLPFKNNLKPGTINKRIYK